MKTVAVVDYGMGNLRSVAQAVLHVSQGSGFEVVVTSKPDEVRAADRIVLPVSHSSMLVSRAVARQIGAFLRDAHFDHGAAA